MTPASSPWSQLWVPIALAGQSISRASLPTQRTLSRVIGPDPWPYPASLTPVEPEYMMKHVENMNNIKFVKQLAHTHGASIIILLRHECTNHTTSGTLKNVLVVQCKHMCTREFNNYNVNDSHLFQRIPTACKRRWHQHCPIGHHTQYPTDDCCISQAFLQMEKSHWPAWGCPVHQLSSLETKMKRLQLFS